MAERPWKFESSRPHHALSHCDSVVRAGSANARSRRRGRRGRASCGWAAALDRAEPDDRLVRRDLELDAEVGRDLRGGGRMRRHADRCSEPYATRSNRKKPSKSVRVVPTTLPPASTSSRSRPSKPDAAALDHRAFDVPAADQTDLDIGRRRRAAERRPVAASSAPALGRTRLVSSIPTAIGDIGRQAADGDRALRIGRAFRTAGCRSSPARPFRTARRYRARHCR